MTPKLLDRTIKEQNEIVYKNSPPVVHVHNWDTRGGGGGFTPGRCDTCQRRLEKKRKRIEKSTLKID